jgi:hypothetical protein
VADFEKLSTVMALDERAEDNIIVDVATLAMQGYAAQLFDRIVALGGAAR